MTPPPLPPDRDLVLEPVEGVPGAEPVVSDVEGRLWRVRRRPSGVVADILLALLLLVTFAGIAVALIV